MRRPPAPLVSQTPVKDVQFAHFGVLDPGAQGKGSIFTSLGVNAALVLIAIVIGAATKVQIQKQKEQVTLVVPIKDEIKPKPPEPPKPPPKPLPKPPVLKPVEPKIVLEKVKIPDPPKVVVKMPDVKPIVPVMPAPPKQVIAAAAPKPVAISMARSASVVNNDAHPTAVALGRPDNPIAVSNRPATSAVNLGNKGLAGMPASNTGGGPRSTSVNLGSGQPGGSMTGTGPKAIAGVKLGGITGGTGTTAGNGIGTRAVQLGQAAPPPPPQRIETARPVSTAPKVTYKPNPVYTTEAQQMHLEGDVSVRIKVLASGQVQVLGIVSGLGHGLDESAIRSVQATRFQPAKDAAGNPIDWEGIVKVKFQLAG
jgi:TonB family protein